MLCTKIPNKIRDSKLLFSPCVLRMISPTHIKCILSICYLNAKTMKYTLTTTVKHLVLFMCSIREVLSMYLNCRLHKLYEVGYKSSGILEFSVLKRNQNSAMQRSTDLLVQSIWYLDVLQVSTCTFVLMDCTL